MFVNLVNVVNSNQNSLPIIVVVNAAQVEIDLVNIKKRKNCEC